MFLADKKQSYDKLLGQSYSAFGTLWKKILPIVFIQWVTYAILLGVGAFFFSGYFSDQAAQVNPASSFNSFMHLPTAMGVSFLILFGLVGLYFTIVVFHRADGVLSDDAQKTDGAWSAGLHRLLPTVGYIVLLALGFGVFAALSLLVAGFMPFTWLKVLMLVLAGLLAIHLVVRLIYGMPLIISRGVGVFGALTRSFQLTKGYFWRLFGMYILVVIIPGFALSLLAIPVHMILAATGSDLIIIAGSLLTSFIQNFIVTTLMLGGLYVFLNDGIHHHKGQQNVPDDSTIDDQS